MTAIGTIPVLFSTGIHASRPAASAVGKGGLYSCTTHSLVYQTDGSSWTTWATLGAVDDATISTTDITTNNSSTSKHGWLKKLDNNAAHYMDGTGAWGTPSGSGGLARTTLGTTSAGGSFRTARANYLKKITMPANGFLASVVANVKGNASGGVLGAGVWSDSGGAPVLVIASVNPVVDGGVNSNFGPIMGTSARWVTTPIMAYLAAGDYWIGVAMNAGADSRVQLAYSAGTGSDLTQTLGSIFSTPADISYQATSSTTDDHSIYANILS